LYVSASHFERIAKTTRSLLLKAVVKKQPGKTIFKAGMMTRILQGGWVRAGDLVEVLTPVEIVNEG